jgi:ASPIC and UnbV
MGIAFSLASRTTRWPRRSAGRGCRRSSCDFPFETSAFPTWDSIEGTTSNRDAVVAQVTVTVSGRTQIVARVGGGSYLSASDSRVHFGLGPAKKADRVEVAWPSGRRDQFDGLAADTGYRLIERSREPKPMAGFSSPKTQR